MYLIEDHFHSEVKQSKAIYTACVHDRYLSLHYIKSTPYGLLPL